MHTLTQQQAVEPHNATPFFPPATAQAFCTPSMPACKPGIQPGPLGYAIYAVRATDAPPCPDTDDAVPPCIAGGLHPWVTRRTNTSTLLPLFASLLQEGFRIIPTNMPGNVKAWSYAQIGGSLPIPATSMPVVRSCDIVECI